MTIHFEHRVFPDCSTGCDQSLEFETNRNDHFVGATTQPRTFLLQLQLLPQTSPCRPLHLLNRQTRARRPESASLLHLLSAVPKLVSLAQPLAQPKIAQGQMHAHYTLPIFFLQSPLRQCNDVYPNRVSRSMLTNSWWQLDSIRVAVREITRSPQLSKISPSSSTSTAVIPASAPTAQS